MSGELFICETGQLTAESRRALKRAGIIVAEVADISRCQFVRASELVSADDLLWTALDALCLRSAYGSTGEKQRERLAENLLTVVNTRRARPVEKELGP